MINHFDSEEGARFVNQDNRKVRQLAIVSAETLHSRHVSYFSGEFSPTNQSILDVGCCIGATGFWVLKEGAKLYTGIEPQLGYANIATTLLPSSEIIKAGAIEGLDMLIQSGRKFDIGCALGVIYSFSNPQDLLSRLSKLCDKIIVDFFPINDDRHDMRSNGYAGKIQLSKSMHLNSAAGAVNATGLGSTISFVGLNTLMKENGFDFVDKPMPTKKIEVTDELDIYHNTFCGNNHVMQFRVIHRYKRGTPISNVASYYANNYDGEGVSNVSWDIVPMLKLHINVNHSAVINAMRGDWSFKDARVVDGFQYVANSSIPRYIDTIDDCIDIAETVGDECKILDFGCSKGYTLQRFNIAGFNALYGIDDSAEMIGNQVPFANKNNKLHIGREIPDHFPSDFDLIMVNWTLQFITDEAERIAMIKHLVDHLSSSGRLVITEKLDTNSTSIKSMYKDFKRGNGITEEEIVLKEQSISSIMKPKSMDWYCGVFKELGIKYGILGAKLNFVSFICEK